MLVVLCENASDDATKLVDARPAVATLGYKQHEAMPPWPRWWPPWAS